MELRDAREAMYRFFRLTMNAENAKKELKNWEDTNGD